MTESRRQTSRAKVNAYRERLRKQGLRPIQIWVPDVRSRKFAAEARRQSKAVAKSRHATRESSLHRRHVGRFSGMRRGELWTAAGGTDYASKPRPVVIVQDDRVGETESVTVCAFTTDPTTAPLIRLAIEPSEQNGLRSASRLMVDKPTTVPRTKLGMRLGQLEDEHMVRVNRAMRGVSRHGRSFFTVAGIRSLSPAAR